MRRALLAFSLSAFVFPSNASAQPPPAPELSPPAAPAATEEAEKLARAIELFRQGNELRKAGQCESALRLYEESRALVPSSANTMNSAFCMAQLGRDDEALDRYEDLIARFSADLTESDRKRLAPAMAALRQKVALLEISANVEGIVVVDGRMRGRLPLLVPLRVLPGTRRVRVLKDGFETFEASIALGAAEVKTLDARLRPLEAAGVLAIDCPDLPGAEVTIDGAVLGACPWEGTLSPGPHLFWVRKGASGSEPRVATVVARQTARLSAKTTLLGPETELTVAPATARLTLDGVPLGAGNARVALAPGHHGLRAEEAGYETATVVVDGARGGRVRLELRIDPDHPRWPKPEAPPAGDFFIEATSGPALLLVAGGEPSSACDDVCTVDPPIGVNATLRAGWTSRLGLGVSLDAGYQLTQTGFSDRAAALSPIGLAPLVNEGTIEERIRYSAFVAGASGHYRAAGDWPWGVRLGAGFAIGQVSDSRAGSFRSSAGAAYQAAQSSSDGATYVYVQPEVRVGRALGAGLDLSLALAGAFHFALSRPVWSNLDIVPTSNDPEERGDGGAIFDEAEILGPVLFALIPSLSLRWQLP